MAGKKDVSLINFFVFNPKFGPREGEEEKKILFYYPHSVAIDTKIKQIGLCEAIIKFTSYFALVLAPARCFGRFGPFYSSRVKMVYISSATEDGVKLTFTDHPSESLHTQKTRQLFFQPEPDFWMVMTVNVPFTEKVADGQTLLEYQEEDVQDHVYRAVLQQTYHLYRLFNGTFQNTLAKGDVEALKQRIDHFFSKYLVTLRLNQVDIMTVFNGIQFLPLDKNSYLRLQCFINQMEMMFSQIRYSVVLYNSHLVWSGLEQEDMRILYSYLTASLLPAINEQEFSTASLATSAESSHFGRFVLGPPNLQNETNTGRILRVHLNGSEDEMEECFLVVYRALGALMCLLIKGDRPIEFDFFRKVDKYMGPQLSSIASDIAELTTKKTSSSTDTQFKYVYFNRMNLAQKTSIHLSDGTTPTVSPDVLRLIADVNNDLNTVTEVEDGETIIKMSNDSWVVGKKSDQREVYIIIHQKNANLIEINGEVDFM